MCSRVDLLTHAGSAVDNPVTLTFDLRVNASRGRATLYVSADFGVDILLEYGQTDTHTYTRTLTQLATQRQSCKPTPMRY